MARSEAKKRADAKYRAKTYKRVPLDLRNEDYDELKAHCEKIGEPINTFIRRLIKEAIEKGE